MLSINDQPAFFSIMLDYERLCRTSVLIFNILIYVLVRMKGVYDSVQSGPYLDIAECKAQRRFPSGFLGIRCWPSHFNPIEIMYSLQPFFYPLYQYLTSLSLFATSTYSMVGISIKLGIFNAAYSCSFFT